MSSTSKLDLHSGLPYWLVVNGLLGDFPPLQRSLPDEDIVIIGAGISGALVAHELCSAGFRCTMIDRRLLSSGSTWASTAHLNYELDTSLTDLTKKYGEDAAVRIYQASVQAVARVAKVLTETCVDASYESKPSLYFASDRKGAKANEAEAALRNTHGLAVELLDNSLLKSAYGIDRRNAILHQNAAQIDAYRAASGLIRFHAESGALRVFTRTEIKKLKAGKGGVELTTTEGLRIHARHVVCAPGYESAAFLPKRVMDINSTYALATRPLGKDELWKDGALIWETARPYCYLRTTAEGRILIGGGDIRFKNEAVRDSLLWKKEAMLLEQAAALLPQLGRLTADFTWCGSFGETVDGLPYIGEYPGIKGVSFALGYGGNGITFSMIAAGIIRNKLQGKPDDREALFAFGR